MQWMGLDEVIAACVTQAVCIMLSPVTSVTKVTDLASSLLTQPETETYHDCTAVTPVVSAHCMSIYHLPGHQHLYSCLWSQEPSKFPSQQYHCNLFYATCSGTAVIWVVSSFLSESLVSAKTSGKALVSPFLLTYLGTTLFTIYLPIIYGIRWCSSRCRRQSRGVVCPSRQSLNTVVSGVGVSTRWVRPGSEPSVLRSQPSPLVVMNEISSEACCSCTVLCARTLPMQRQRECLSHRVLA